MTAVVVSCSESEAMPLNTVILTVVLEILMRQNHTRSSLTLRGVEGWRSVVIPRTEGFSHSTTKGPDRNAVLHTPWNERGWYYARFINSVAASQHNSSTRNNNPWLLEQETTAMSAQEQERICGHAIVSRHRTRAVPRYSDINVHTCAYARAFDKFKNIMFRTQNKN